MGVSTKDEARLLSDTGLPERYPIVRRIAHGGMASVWCADDLVLGRRVAIKLLSDQFLHDPIAVQRFQREARAAAHLSGHPNVVTIFDVGQTKPGGGAESGRPFIVMECLAGGTVADALRADEVSREDALTWIQQAADALDYAHGRGVIHRDIKPANLLLGAQRVLHVADFGIARVGTEDPITSSGELFGTAAYFSPEQAMGRPATAASDRYALAVVAFELLVGERPFTAENFAAQARQQVEQEPPRASERNPAVPRALDAVLARGMAKPPEQRWSSAGEFAQAVRRAAETRAPGTSAPVLPEPTLESPRVPPPRAAAAAAIPLASAATPRAAVPSPPRAPAPAGPPSPPRFTTHRSSGGAPRRSRALAFAALAAVAVAVAAAAATGIGGSPTPARTARAGAGTPTARRSHRHARPAAAKPAAKSGAAAGTTPSSSTTAGTAASSTSPGSTAPPTGATPTPTSANPSASAADLQSMGHQLILRGDYTGAVGVLRQAVAAGPSTGLTYAYALYDLGHALRLAGDPRDAAVVLQRRLQIPNQTDVVRQELQLALQAIGAQASGGKSKGKSGGN